MTKQAIDRGEVVYGRLGDAVLEGSYTEWQDPEASFPSDTWHSWRWTLDGKELTITDEKGETYTLPTDNALLARLEEGKLVEFTRKSGTHFVAKVSTYYSHHYGSVSSEYTVTVDTAALTAVVEQTSSDVDID